MPVHRSELWRQRQRERGPVLKRISAEGLKNYYAYMAAKRVVPKVLKPFYTKLRNAGLTRDSAVSECRRLYPAVFAETL